MNTKSLMNVSWKPVHDVDREFSLQAVMDIIIRLKKKKRNNSIFEFQ